MRYDRAIIVKVHEFTYRVIILWLLVVCQGVNKQWG